MRVRAVLGRSRLAAAVLVVAGWAAASGCDEERLPLRWTVRVDAAVGVPTQAHVVIHDGPCLGTGDVRAERARFEAHLALDGRATSVSAPLLGRGTYCFAAEVAVGSCLYVAEGHAEVVLPGQRAEVTTVVDRTITEPRLVECPVGACVGGLCAVPDAGPMDAGAIDGGLGPIDAGPFDGGGAEDGGDGGECLQIRAVSLGFRHACAITEGSELYCWGDNHFGQLGDGRGAPEVMSNRPVLVGDGWLGVAAGVQHTCAIDLSERMFCWGTGENGALGGGAAFEMRTTPSAVSTSLRWTQVSAGSDFSCAQTSESPPAVYCWGDNRRGQLGDTTTLSRPTPVAVQGGGDLDVYSVLSSGAGHTCYASGTGAVFCWGDNRTGQTDPEDLGHLYLAAPVEVSLPAPFARVSAGQFHTCAVHTGTNMVWCWGSNQNLQSGQVDSAPNVVTPAAVADATSTLSVAAGTLHTCAVNYVAEDLSCWGSNLYGQLGSSTGDTSEPRSVGHGGTWRQAFAGGQVSGSTFDSAFSCGTKGDGSLYCWGSNGRGQLGVGDSAAHPAPTRVCMRP